MTERRLIPAVIAVTSAVVAVIVAMSGPAAPSSSTGALRSAARRSQASTFVAASAGQEAVSANWAGYAVSGTSAGFSSVSGSWVEPSVSCASAADDVAFWVGLGGAAGQSQELEQVGTQAQCDSSGNVNHFAWYELLPAAPVKLDLAILPGDHISAKVSVSGSSVTVALSDATSGQSATQMLAMDAPDTSSAEWIAEAPSSCDQTGNCHSVPLADFTNVNFTDAAATSDGHTGAISDPNWTAQSIGLDSMAEPSTLSADGASFAVGWQAIGSPQPASGPADGFSAQGDPGVGYGAGYGYGYGDYGYVP